MFGKKGFTLVEVLIVVIIIAILAAIGIPQYAKTIEKARGGEMRAGLANIQSAEKIFYAENEKYTANMDELDIVLQEKGWDFSVTLTTDGFDATATRKGSGPETTKTVIMDELGELTGTWPYI